MIRVLIVDDEPLARKGIRRLLEKEADVKILGECADGIEALEFIKKEQPDIVILDIQMPELDGFGVLEALNDEKLPVVIFTTAFDEFALKAFSVHALDYILKPVKPEQFTAALERARAIIQYKQGRATEDKLKELLQYVSSKRQYLERLIVKTGKNIVVINVKDVDWFESYGDYIRITLAGKKHLIRKTMNELEQSLDPAMFARIHRSIIVRIESVQNLQPLSNGDYTVRLKNGTELSLSRTYSAKFLEAIQM